MSFHNSIIINKTQPILFLWRIGYLSRFITTNTTHFTLDRIRSWQHLFKKGVLYCYNLAYWRKPRTTDQTLYIRIHKISSSLQRPTKATLQFLLSSTLRKQPIPRIAPAPTFVQGRSQRLPKEAARDGISKQRQQRHLLTV